VFEFFEQQKLTPELLRKLYEHQKEILRESFFSADFDSNVIKLSDAKNTAGFQTFISPYAGKFSTELRKYNVFSDSRGDFLRFGPAPYLSDNQLRKAIDYLKEISNNLV